MPIPVKTRILWRLLNVGNATPMLQLPVGEIPAAREARKKILRVPGAKYVTGRPHPGVDSRDVTVELGVDRRIRVRVYRPRDAGNGALPLIANYHGGGFVGGDPEQSEWWCSYLAHAAGAVVVSVDYRLAPEHVYPAAPDDCYDATVWAVAHAAELGADGTRLAVMGDSAGGNLAAVVALMARDRGGPPIALQVLLYPAVEMVKTFPSEDENEFAPILGKADLGVSAVYCPGHETEPYASPLRADHAGLAPALIQTAQFDPLRDQGTAYAGALRDAGVPVRLTNYADAVHGFISLPGVVPVARQALSEAAAELRSAFVATG